MSMTSGLKAADRTVQNPAEGVLTAYGWQHPDGDLFSTAPDEVKAKWQKMADGMAALCRENYDELHQQLAHRVRDMGVAFRISGDNEERVWPLNPLPLIIGTEEWRGIERGLVQRAELLELIVADIYDNQALVKQGDLPALAVSGSPQFIRKMIGTAPPRGKHLHFYAVDLARGPNGEWRVLADRVRLPTGIGYALENRLALSRSTGTLLTSINTRRLASFYSGLRQGIARDCDRADPRIALLTPGRFNQSYPEQAHLARYLGFPLVEGRDLAVSENKLFVRTIEGLKRVDAIWRWIDTQNIDPLAFDSRSAIGVPNIFDAWSNAGLVVANWPGSGVVESRAFSAFLPRLARKLLGEPLLLPNMATWWCGQVGEYETTVARMDELVISSAFGQPVPGLPEGRSRAGASLSAAERETLLAAMALRPMDYTGQEVVRLSTTPSLVQAHFEPRPFTLRAFVARDGNGDWIVMPGGFARLSTEGSLRTSLMGDGDISADVCIVDETPMAQDSPLSNLTVPAIRRTSGILPSQAADNLYWFSRYCERAEMTVRIIDTLLGNSIDVDGGGARTSDTARRLIGMLINWGTISKADGRRRMLEIAHHALYDRAQTGSIAALANTIRTLGQGLRDRMSMDFWRTANLQMPHDGYGTVESMSQIAKQMIDRLSSLAGLAAENMGRNAGWQFFDLGRRVERAINVCRITRQLAAGDLSIDDLGVLLDLCDSQISYRTRYLIGPMAAPVLDLIMLDPQNPRALSFQLAQIERHLATLPSQRADGLPEAPLRAAQSILARVNELEPDDLSGDQLRDIETRLLALSDLISQRYFLQYEKAAEPTRKTLIG
jgi:uncharacterized circularly permuted ATP-grasp superfamily protein/uncharacterized alpha-E superfamily protein